MPVSGALALGWMNLATSTLFTDLEFDPSRRDLAERVVARGGCLAVDALGDDAAKVQRYEFDVRINRRP